MYKVFNVLKKFFIEKREVMLKLLFCISLSTLTFILSVRAHKLEILIGVILSFIIGVILSFKLFKDMFRKYNYKILCVSIIISLYLEKIFMLTGFPIKKLVNEYLYKIFSINLSEKNIEFILVLLSIFALTEIVYIFIIKVIPKCREFYDNMTKFDKKVIVIITIVGFFITFILYNLTNCFYNPSTIIKEKSFPVLVDIVYKADSGTIYQGNAFLNFNMGENDLRQPLFALFATPFAVIAYILSDLLFFIPNIYAILINTIQIFLIAISIYMITEMLKLDNKNKLLYYMFSFSTFPLIIFSFVIEQYVFALFYLILVIYYSYKNLKINYMYIGAVGTLVTSGIIFPLISKFKNFKYWFVNVFKCFIAYVSLIIVTGQLTLYLNFKDQIKMFMNFSGTKLLFVDKLKQFLYFVRSIFIAPSGVEKIYKSMPPTYQMVKVNFVCITGIIILILCLISFIMNRKNKLAKISFLWIIFSFLLLCIFGWGTSENGLVLYTLYFSWAYLILMYLFIDKIIKNRKVKLCILVCICLVLFSYNMLEFLKIIKFGLTYYSV